MSKQEHYRKMVRDCSDYELLLLLAEVEALFREKAAKDDSALSLANTRAANAIDIAIDRLMNT